MSRWDAERLFFALDLPIVEPERLGLGATLPQHRAGQTGTRVQINGGRMPPSMKGGNVPDPVISASSTFRAQPGSSIPGTNSPSCTDANSFISLNLLSDSHEYRHSDIYSALCRATRWAVISCCQGRSRVGWHGEIAPRAPREPSVTGEPTVSRHSAAMLIISGFLTHAQ